MLSLSSAEASLSSVALLVPTPDDDISEASNSVEGVDILSSNEERPVSVVEKPPKSVVGDGRSFVWVDRLAAFFLVAAAFRLVAVFERDAFLSALDFLPFDLAFDFLPFFLPLALLTILLNCIPKYLFL